MIGQQGRDAGRKQCRWLASAVHRACRTGRRTFFEALESRQLLSATFTYDLRLAPGQEAESADGHSVDLSQPHADTYTLQLWGQITGDSNLSNDLFSCGYVSIASTQVNGYGALAGGGITDGEVNAAIFSAFPDDAQAADITDDGVADWGSGNAGDDNGWMFWASASDYSWGLGYRDGKVVPGMSEPIAGNPNGWEVLIATFTVDTSILAAPDGHVRTTTFNVALPRSGIVYDVPDLVCRPDGEDLSLNDAEVGGGVSFVLESTAPAVNDFSKSLFANTSAAFSAPDFSGAFSGGPAGGPLQSVRIDSLPAHGALTVGGGEIVAAGDEIAADQLENLVYTPNAEYAGPDGFEWNATDGTVYAGTDAAVSLTVNPDPAPSATDALGFVDRIFPYAYTFAETDFTVHFSDVIPGDALQSVIIESLPHAGELTFNGAAVSVPEEIPIGQISGLAYQNAGESTVQDSFGWVGVDARGTPSNLAKANLLGDGSKVSDFSVQTAYDAALSFSGGLFTASYYDFYYGQPLAGITITSLPSSGVLALNGTPLSAGEQVSVGDLGGLTYTPTGGFSGADAFSWVAFDGFAFSYRQATVNIAVSAPPSPATPPAATGTSSVVIGQTGSVVVPIGILSLPRLPLPFPSQGLSNGVPTVGGAGPVASVFVAAPQVALQPMAPLAPVLVEGGPIALVSGVELGSVTAPTTPSGGDAVGAPPAVVQGSPVFVAPALPLSAVSTLNTLTQTLIIASGDALSPVLSVLQRALDGLAGSVA